MVRVPICYCGNRRIFGGIFLSVLSIMQHTEAPLEIILLSMDLSDENPVFLPFSEEQRALMEKILREKNGDSCVRIIDVTDLHKKYFGDGKNNKNNYTPYASIRLFLDLLDVPEKIVYLDADIMCNGDVLEYYNIDISEYEFAATLDIVGRHYFRGKYCNSGTMLLNMPAIKETGLFEKARKMVNERWMLMPDQSAIHRSATRKLLVPYRFNEQRNMKPDTVFKHFCKGFPMNFPLFPSYNWKQWHRKEVHEKLKIFEFDDVYAIYDKIMEDGSASELIRI